MVKMNQKLKLIASDVDLKNLEIEDNTIILKKFSVFMANKTYINDSAFTAPGLCKSSFKNN